MRTKDALKIYSLLLKHYPDALDSPTTVGRGTPFQVLILTILSAQTTDRAVLLVKKPLFAQYPAPDNLAKADIADVETIIHRLGFYHAKARHIIAAAQMVISESGGMVPSTMEGLLKLPGVGRKTANIVLYHAFAKNEGVAVDTHVKRLAQRIGFSDTNDQDRIEQDLMRLFPQDLWGDLTDILIAHGRTCCTAKRPGCDRCPIGRYCRYFTTVVKKVE
jgi:endonuclease-3